MHSGGQGVHPQTGSSQPTPKGTGVWGRVGTKGQEAEVRGAGRRLTVLSGQPARHTRNTQLGLQASGWRPHPTLLWGRKMTWRRGGKAGPPWSSVMTLLVVTPDCDAGEAPRFPGPNPAHAPSCWRSSGLALLPWPGVGGRCPQGPGCRLCCGRAGTGQAAAPRGSISQPQPRRAPHLVPVAGPAGGLVVAKPAVDESPALGTFAVTLTSMSKGSSRPGTIPS